MNSFLDSAKSFFNFIFDFKNAERKHETEIFALASTTSSAIVAANVMLMLELIFFIMSIVRKTIFGNYLWGYRTCYIVFALNCLLLIFSTLWAKKKIRSRYLLLKIVNYITSSIYLLWAVSITHLDQLNGYSSKPIIFMSIALIIVCSIYVTPLYYIIATVISNALYIMIMLFGMKKGDVTPGDLTNYCVFSVVSFVISLSFLYNRYKYYIKVYEQATIKANSQKTEELLEQTTLALALTIDAKDTYTNGHSVRVAKYSKMIAQKMGLDENSTKEIFYMGLLHDVGKIGISEEIIHKPSKLTDEEFEKIKKHPEIGNEILSTIKAMPSLAEGALFHHERFDGHGYPTEYSGKDIPLAARIICVADSYDAMTSKRSYRDVMPQEKAREQIVLGRGTQFDPAIADIMLSIIDEDKDFKLREGC